MGNVGSFSCNPYKGGGVEQVFFLTRRGNKVQLTIDDKTSEEIVSENIINRIGFDKWQNSYLTVSDLKYREV